MFFAISFISGHGVEADSVKAVENTLFKLRIITAEAFYKLLYLLTLGTAAAVIAHGAVLGKTAGALNELQIVIAFPRDNIVLMHAVQRADEGHALKVGAVELGQHSLKL